MGAAGQDGGCGTSAGMTKLGVTDVGQQFCWASKYEYLRGQRGHTR